jgi:hypothetical protein
VNAQHTGYPSSVFMTIRVSTNAPLFDAASSSTAESSTRTITESGWASPPLNSAT